MEHSPTVLMREADPVRPPAATGQVVLRRIAHASVLLDFDGFRILTDPWFSERWGYYHGEPYGITLADLPHLDGVLVSHDHYDHFDLASFRRYPDKTVPMVVKRGLAAKARAAGFRDVRELDAWETTTLGPLTITGAPGKHKVPEITFMLEGRGLSVYFGADTLLIPELREVARRFPRIDLALVPVNGLTLRPLLNRQVVMNAREAAELCAMLRPRVAVPTHYAFTGGPIQDRLVLKYTGTAEEFAREAARRAPGTEVRILAPGEPLVVAAAPTSGPNGGGRGSAAHPGGSCGRA
jgi:L-ascorbate metabolism protein UlaG (beta-lactamase superfamily)